MLKSLHVMREGKGKRKHKPGMGTGAKRQSHRPTHSLLFLLSPEKKKDVMNGVKVGERRKEIWDQWDFVDVDSLLD